MFVALSHYVRGLFIPTVRDMTPEEYRLSREVESLHAGLRERDITILEQRTQIDIQASQIRIRDESIKEMAAVIVRNQKRIETETAEWAHRQALLASNTHHALPPR